jgi:hypothetical protein
MKPRASSDIHLTAEENPGKSQVRGFPARPSDEGCMISRLLKGDALPSNDQFQYATC